MVPGLACIHHMPLTLLPAEPKSRLAASERAPRRGWRFVVPFLMVFCVAGCSSAATRVAAPVVRLVRVRTSGCISTETSTGFVVRPGMVITVAHALHDATTVAVDGDAAEVVAVNERMDAALLKWVGSPDRQVAFAPPTLGMAAHVLRWNHGRAQRIDANVTTVAPIDYSDLRLHTEYLRDGLLIDQESRPGDSGAPVIDRDGAVVGMLFASRVNDTPEGFAVASNELQALIAAGPAAQPWVGGCT